MTCQPNWLCTGVWVVSPFLSAITASENGCTICCGLNQPRSPPRSLEPGSLESFLASASNFSPFWSLAMMSLASFSVSTRMCLALYSVFFIGPTRWSYSFFRSSSDTSTLPMNSSAAAWESSMRWALSILAANLGSLSRPDAAISWLSSSRLISSSTILSSGTLLSPRRSLTSSASISKAALLIGLPLTMATDSPTATTSGAAGAFWA